MATEDVSTWNVVYPCYIDKTKTCSAGRKVSIKHSVENPTVEEIKLVCDKLELKCLVEHEKSHPKDWPTKGRVRVFIPSDGHNDNPKTKLQLLRNIGSMIPLLKSRQEPPPSKSKPQETNESTTSKSQKKKKGKNK